MSPSLAFTFFLKLFSFILLLLAAQSIITLCLPLGTLNEFQRVNVKKDLFVTSIKGARKSIVVIFFYYFLHFKNNLPLLHDE